MSSLFLRPTTVRPLLPGRQEGVALGLVTFRAYSVNAQTAVIPSGADRLFPPTSLLRCSRSAQSRNLSSPLSFFNSDPLTDRVRSATITALAKQKRGEL